MTNRNKIKNNTSYLVSNPDDKNKIVVLNRNQILSNRNIYVYEKKSYIKILINVYFTLLRLTYRYKRANEIFAELEICPRTNIKIK